MKYIYKYKLLLLLLPFLLLLGCSSSNPTVKLDKLELRLSSHTQLDGWENQDFDTLLSLFNDECVFKKTQRIYKDVCLQALDVNDSKAFFEENFGLYQVLDSEKEDNTGMLTGYYEASLKGSLTQSEVYPYPVYGVPNDLISVDLSSIYSELKGKRLRGKIVGHKLVPYAARSEMSDLNSSVICYVDDKIDLFFLEVQGSGRIELDNNETIFVGYANQNGHKYRSIGRYLVQKKEIPLEEISLQSIRAWLEEHPERVDEVLNYNASYVFFERRQNAATGALGIELQPEYAVAVDPKYIPLGSLVYIDSTYPDGEQKLKKLLFAQDTGGAIKGAVRADLFFGFGERARELAGKMKQDLKMYILLPVIEEIE